MLSLWCVHALFHCCLLPLLLLLLCCGWRPVQARAHPVLLSIYCVPVACCGCVPAFVAAAAAAAAVLCTHNVETRHKNAWEALVPYHTHDLALLALVLASHNLQQIGQGKDGCSWQAGDGSTAACNSN